MKNKILITITTLAIITRILSFTNLTFLESLRITLGTPYVLFLPGYIISFIFFKKIDIIERIALSFALSIAIVPLVIFYLNLIGMKINLLSSILSIAGIIILSLLILKKKNI
ncbi:DUF1616 domain-containing protein [Candidatus Woesearchaeota archaeon]|jgi:uncharacterized membrane protein|nr:DUF1616 domain-containing protein [Candidatus Woesearchaeota archaeon]